MSQPFLGLEYKYLPPYSPFFMEIESLSSEWKYHVQFGLQNRRARNEEDLMERINDFQLAEDHAAAYFEHIEHNYKV